MHLLHLIYASFSVPKCQVLQGSSQHSQGVHKNMNKVYYTSKQKRKSIYIHLYIYIEYIIDAQHQVDISQNL